MKYGESGLSAHDGREPLQRPVGNGAERVVAQMGVAFGSAGLAMPELLADEIEAVAYGDRGKAVAKVAKSNSASPAERPLSAIRRVIGGLP